MNKYNYILQKIIIKEIGLVQIRGGQIEASSFVHAIKHLRRLTGKGEVLEALWLATLPLKEKQESYFGSN